MAFVVGTSIRACRRFVSSFVRLLPVEDCLAVLCEELDRRRVRFEELASTRILKRAKRRAIG